MWSCHSLVDEAVQSAEPGSSWCGRGRPLHIQCIIAIGGILILRSCASGGKRRAAISGWKPLPVWVNPIHNIYIYIYIYINMTQCPWPPLPPAMVKGEGSILSTL